jgi:hypothetical protein
MAGFESTITAGEGRRPALDRAASGTAFTPTESVIVMT